MRSLPELAKQVPALHGCTTDCGQIMVFASAQWLVFIEHLCKPRFCTGVNLGLGAAVMWKYLTSSISDTSKNFVWHLLEGQNTKHYCTWTLRDRRHWSFAHQGPTPMGWTSYSHGGKQNTKGTLLRGAGRWSAFTRRSAQEVQGCLEIQPESMWHTHWNLRETRS